MSPKKLAGYLLVVGPIVTFVVMMFLWDAIIGNPDESLIGQEKIKAGMELGMDNFVLTQIIASLATFGMLAMWFGYTFWARSLQSDDKKSGILGTVAALIIPVAAAGFLFSMDINFAAAFTWEDGDIGNALITATVADSVSWGSTLIWASLLTGIGLIGLASALQSEDKVSKSIGAILAVLAAAMIVINYSTISGAGFILFMLVMLATVIAGANLIRLKA